MNIPILQNVSTILLQMEGEFAQAGKFIKDTLNEVEIGTDKVIEGLKNTITELEKKVADLESKVSVSVSVNENTIDEPKIESDVK